jgi:signal transducing adaptor molecule
MEFLSSTEADLTSAVGALIREATDNSLTTPDWSKILDICDLINNEPQETANQATRVIYSRFQQPEQNVCSLTLVLIESCMKNCREKYSDSINSQFIDVLVDIAKGSSGLRNSEEALRIIQDWGREFEGQRAVKPIFFDTYVDLKAKGFRFPPEDPKLAAAM